MKYLVAIVVAFLMIAAYFDTCSAVSEPVCRYVNSDGKTIFLKYSPGIRKHEDYADFIEGGRKCVTVKCQSDYTLKIEQCLAVPV